MFPRLPITAQALALLLCMLATILCAAASIALFSQGGVDVTQTIRVRW